MASSSRFERSTNIEALKRGAIKRSKESVRRSFSIKYDQDPNSKLPVKVVKNDIKVEWSEGNILFDREEGHPVSVNVRIRVKGELQLLRGRSRTIRCF